MEFPADILIHVNNGRQIGLGGQAATVTDSGRGHQALCSQTAPAAARFSGKAMEMRCAGSFCMKSDDTSPVRPGRRPTQISATNLLRSQVTLLIHLARFERPLFGALGGVLVWGGFNTFMKYTNCLEFCISCHSMSKPYGSGVRPGGSDTAA
jgi:hypothetical protein